MIARDDLNRTYADISYLSSDRSEKLDLWLPPDSVTRPIPAVLLIHGGGWCIGDKADPRERNIGSNLSKDGFAVVSINYRLNEARADHNRQYHHERVVWPENFRDCQSALLWTASDGAKRYGIDPERIAVMGCSAGGTLALLLGVHHYQTVRAVISFYAPADVRGAYRAAFAGSSDEETLVNASNASPLLQLHSQMPPVLVAHGTADRIVPVCESHALCSALESMGLEHEYWEVSGASHTFHLQTEQLDLQPVVLKFLRRFV